jgi:hypothetical protein
LLVVRNDCALRERTTRNAQQTTNHQLALTTPGISPRKANSLKHILQIWNLRMNPRGLPHSLHLLYRRALNLTGRCCFMINDVFAIFYLFLMFRSASCVLRRA